MSCDHCQQGICRQHVTWILFLFTSAVPYSCSALLLLHLRQLLIKAVLFTSAVLSCSLELVWIHQLPQLLPAAILLLTTTSCSLQLLYLPQLLPWAGLNTSATSAAPCSYTVVDYHQLLPPAVVFTSAAPWSWSEYISYLSCSLQLLYLPQLLPGAGLCCCWLPARRICPRRRCSLDQAISTN